MTFLQLRGVSSYCGFSISKKISPEDHHPHSYSASQSLGPKGSGIRSAQKSNQQELYLSQFISLNSTLYTNNANLYFRPCRLPKNFRQKKKFYCMIKDYFFIGVDLFCLRKSITIFTFSKSPLCHHSLFFPLKEFFLALFFLFK